jgi:type VI protein secretion system component Hcp
MHFVARISKASPKLFLSCATGSHHKVATLSGARTAGKGKTVDFLKYKLADVQVTSVQTATARRRANGRFCRCSTASSRSATRRRPRRQPEPQYGGFDAE